MARLSTKQKPRRSAPLPLLVPCFLAGTSPLLYPRRSMRRSTSEPAASWATHSRLYRQPARSKASQRLRPFYTVLPHKRAGRAMVEPAAGSTAGQPGREQPAAPAILHGLARRIAPQTQPPRNQKRRSAHLVFGTAAPQWEPRKPLGGSDVADRGHRYEERPQHAAVAVEQASIFAHGGDRKKENFKIENS